MLCEAKDQEGLEAWVEECLALEEGGGGGVGGVGGDGSLSDDPSLPNLLPGYIAPTPTTTSHTSASSSAPNAASSNSLLLSSSVPTPNPIGRWYAQYCEAQGDFDRAALYYRRVGDAPALVRLCVASGDLEGAIAIAKASNPPSSSSSSSSSTASTPASPGDPKPLAAGPAAAYLLARHLEGSGDLLGACTWYETAGRYNHAVRCAAGAGKEGEVLALASRAGPATQLSVARNLEAAGGATGMARVSKKAPTFTLLLLCTTPPPTHTQFPHPPSPPTKHTHPPNL